MNPGDHLVCTEDDWHNAFGDRHTILRAGMRVTVKERSRLNGATFLSFEAVARLN